MKNWKPRATLIAISGEEYGNDTGVAASRKNGRLGFARRPLALLLCDYCDVVLEAAVVSVLLLLVVVFCGAGLEGAGAESLAAGALGASGAAGVLGTVGADEESGATAVALEEWRGALLLGTVTRSFAVSCVLVGAIIGAGCMAMLAAGAVPASARTVRELVVALASATSVCGFVAIALLAGMATCACEAVVRSNMNAPPMATAVITPIAIPKCFTWISR